MWTDVKVDVLMLAASLALICAYHLFLLAMLRRNPNYTFQAVMARSRAAWTHAVMEGGKDILAVQTLRNSTMAATFLASTAIFLITGVLTLSTQGDKLADTWHALNAGGSVGSQVWMMKILAILVDLFAAFFGFTMSIRYFHHVGYMVNVPLTSRHGAIPPALVIKQLDRAGRFYWVGMRAYFLLAPLVLWLFGPQLMLVGAAFLVVVLYRLDRLPCDLDRPEHERPPEPAPTATLVSLRK